MHEIREISDGNTAAFLQYCRRW